jgi:hypothetical protein
MNNEITIQILATDGPTILMENSGIDVFADQTQICEVLVSPMGERGPQGYAGSTGNPTLKKTAGESISGGKVVTVGDDGKVYVFNPLNENHYGKMCGIAKQAAAVGSELEIYFSGEALEVGSGWKAGVVYFIGANGLLTSIPPATGIIKMMGLGVADDTVLITNVFEILTT